MKLYLYDDAVGRGWDPFSMTRPVGELLFGCSLLRERAEAVWQMPCIHYLAGSALLDFDEAGTPTVVEYAAIDRSEDCVLLNSRVSWNASALPALDQPAQIVVDGQVVGWILPAGAAHPSEEALLGDSGDPAGAKVVMAGTVLDEPWSLVAANARAVTDQASSLGLYRLAIPDGVHVLGDEDVYGGSGTTVEPGVVLDVRGGPIVLEADVNVQGPARLTGPLYVGPHSVILGGAVGTSSIGPRCKVRGEVADSVLIGFTNKAHDGHLGHALLGRWVNLGAMTTNSDLKNTYGEVRVDRGRGPEPTGMMKVGCFLGDFVRTGIGTMIGTGAVFGAGTTVFGTGTPTFVPPFVWASGGIMSDYRVDGFLNTARTVMARRDQVMSTQTAGLLESAWNRSADIRRERGVRS